MTNKTKLEILIADIIKCNISADVGDFEADITAELIVEFIQQRYTFDPYAPTVEFQSEYK